MPPLALPRSLTARLALLFALLAATLLAVVALVLGRAVEGHFAELDHHEVASKLAVIDNLLAQTTTPEALETLPRRLDDALVGHDMVAVLLRDADGAVIYAAHAPSFDAAQLAGERLPPGGRAWTLGERHYLGRERELAIPLPEPVSVRVLVALDITHHADFLSEVRNRLWLGISAAALAAGLLGWFAAHRGLAPLRRVTATAQALSADRLGERLSEKDAPTEVHELAEAFNGMLARLEAAFRRLSDYSSDIAHELRTPVSNLMTETQVALTRARSPEEYREILHSNLEEFDRMARMIADMLFLAKADNGLLPRPAETVALAAEAQALAEFYEALAEEKGVSIAVAGAASVTGDHLMLRRALSNLLSNALRHTPAGGSVTIDIAQRGERVLVTVSNPGPTIPADQLPRLFQRFHRVDFSRTRQGDGAGLGLAITRSIVEAHGGTVGVASADGLTRFWLELPLAASSAESSLRDACEPLNHK